MDTNLKLLRTSRNLTQEQLADALGLKLGTYRNYEQGLREPNGELLILFADFYGVSVDYILKRTSLGSDVPYAAKMIDGLDISDLSEVDKDAIAEYVELRRLRRRMERDDDEE